MKQSCIYTRKSFSCDLRIPSTRFRAGIQHHCSVSVCLFFCRFLTGRASRWADRQGVVPLQCHSGINDELSKPKGKLLWSKYMLCVVGRPCRVIVVGVCVDGGSRSGETTLCVFVCSYESVSCQWKVRGIHIC